MTSAENTADAYQEIANFIQEHLDRAGTPVSDGSAVRSSELTAKAWVAAHPGSIFSGPPSDSMVAEASALLREAIALDHRNTHAMIRLVRSVPAAARRLSEITLKIAARTASLKPDVDGASGSWSVGSTEQRDYVATLFNCAVSLDLAERYAEASALRLQVLKLDKRDGFGCRYDIVAHALMVGDLVVVKRWLKWATRHQQVANFWCWVEVLYVRLQGLSDGVGAFWRAAAIEPMVPIYIAVGPATPGQFLETGYNFGSLEEQEYHAATLHRAWAAHPDDFDWLCELAEQLRQEIKDGTRTPL